MGDERQLMEEAYPGDIVSIFNPGDFELEPRFLQKIQFATM